MGGFQAESIGNVVIQDKNVASFCVIDGTDTLRQLLIFLPVPTVVPKSRRLQHLLNFSKI